MQMFCGQLANSCLLMEVLLKVIKEHNILQYKICLPTTTMTLCIGKCDLISIIKIKLWHLYCITRHLQLINIFTTCTRHFCLRQLFMWHCPLILHVSNTGVFWVLINDSKKNGAVMLWYQRYYWQTCVFADTLEKHFNLRLLKNMAITTFKKYAATYKIISFVVTWEIVTILKIYWDHLIIFHFSSYISHISYFSCHMQKEKY